MKILSYPFEIRGRSKSDLKEREGVLSILVCSSTLHLLKCLDGDLIEKRWQCDLTSMIV